MLICIICYIKYIYIKCGAEKTVCRVQLFCGLTKPVVYYYILICRNYYTTCGLSFSLYIYIYQLLIINQIFTDNVIWNAEIGKYVLIIKMLYRSCFILPRFDKIGKKRQKKYFKGALKSDQIWILRWLIMYR